ncbi:MAG TPA: molybdopterin-dependent oxidoreductase [Acidimicrobiia bacterium]|nr:molybdopterin-dependent oxidoreductase [Acidimicrobiia bacterium]
MSLLSRRRFLQGSVAAGGATLATRFLFGAPETLVRAAGPVGAPAVEDFVNTTCWIGKQECGIRARRVDGRVVKLDGHPDNPRNLGTLCPKGQAQITSLYDPNRITTPLVRTNAKGVPGKWRRATWEEAIGLVAERVGAAQAKNPLLAAWVIGRPKVKAIYNKAFVEATGLTAYGRNGQDCAGPSEDATLATWGVRSVVTPDLRRCRYLVCYWNLTQAGGPELCQITMPREVVDARARGMKVVAINPHGRSVAHLADEWVPIRPGTDMAFWLAVIHTLLAEGYVDEAFLRSHTNAAALVGADGSILQRDGVDLAWDEQKGAATPASADVRPALFGVFEVDGQQVKPALQVLEDHVAEHTPAWASKLCGVPATQIRRVALELGENAAIGSTTVIDGVEVPLRPVAYGLHGTAVKFHDGLQTSRTILLAFMILGAVGAAGSAQLADDEVADPAATHKKWLETAGKAQPKRLDLGGSAWFPLGSSGYLMFPVTVNDPERYGLTYRPEDMAVVASYVNPVLSTRPVDKALEAWTRFGFVAYITPYLCATADHAADVVLPCGTLDKWEGPLGVGTLYATGSTVKAPVMAPLGESRGEIDILTDLCEALGKLGGAGGFVARLNTNLKIAEPYLLPLDRKPTSETILDAWARSSLKMGLDELQQVGVVSKEVPAEELYLRAGEQPFDGVRGHFYLDAFPKIGASMRAAGVPEELWRRYTAYPTWTTPPLEGSPDQYDLYLMDHKRIELKQTRSFELPLLAELVPENPLVMHAAAASRRGLKDGDRVWVESHHPGTGETRKLRTVLRTSQGIRPDTVSLTHHAGRVGQPTVNALFFYGDGLWDISSGWFSHVKVKVWKA